FIMAFFIMHAAEAQLPDKENDSLKTYLLTANEDTNKVITLITLGNNLEWTDTDKALAYGMEALALTTKLQYATGLARANYLLGNLYMDKNDFTISKSYLDQSLRQFEALGRPAMSGKANNAMASWYYVQGDYWNASHFFGKALDIFTQLKDSIREVTVLQNLTACLGVVKQYDKAIFLNKKMIGIFEKWNDSLRLTLSLQSLVFNYTESGRLSDAKPIIPRLTVLAGVLKDASYRTTTFNIIGRFYYFAKQYDSAIIFYERARHQNAASLYDEALYDIYMGQAMLKKSNTKLAGEYLHRGLEKARTSGSIDLVYALHISLAEYYESIKDYKNAYLSMKEFSKSNDSILTSETRQYATYLEANYENEKKERLILDLKLSNTMNELVVSKRKRLLWAVGIGSVGVLLIAVLLLRSGRQKRMIIEKDRALKDEQIRFLERQQQVTSLQAMITGQETERSRIARDLHDGLGGLFSTIKMYFSSLAHEQPQLSKNTLFIKSMELADSASLEMRRIAHNLMPETLVRLGLVNAVQDLCDQINIGGLLKISFQVYGMEQRLNSNVEMVLFRILQEILNNIIKHAHATEVIIQFNKHPDRLTITIEDNGRGFNVAEVSGKDHAGIQTIQSRVDYLNGHLNIESTQGIGTTVVMEFLLDRTIIGNNQEKPL
ncbi:MAG: tetratricopeptide repeat-containing sensor histidine kinase, partial [Flavisolibacter sp.]